MDKPNPTIGKKPVIEVDRRVLNIQSKFKEKLLCDGMTFTAGDSCVYSCAFCYVEAIGIARKDLPEGKKHKEVVIRRKNAVESLAKELSSGKGNPKFNDPSDTRVIYASPLVDVAATVELAEETAAMCKVILEKTYWQIRLLSKSNLLPKIACILDDDRSVKTWARERIIYGVSTGTHDDKLAASFEADTAKVSKRFQSLSWLQANGFRTFGMICPSLPLPDRNYEEASGKICEEIQVDRCEHVWAEVINVRGDSLTATAKGLLDGGFETHAKALEEVSHDKEAWEEYNRKTFLGHIPHIPKEKLRYLTYVNEKTYPWWESQKEEGAVLLGRYAERKEKSSITPG